METQEFSINERFEFLENYIDIIAKNKMNSLIITGTTGIGKTHTVLERLKLFDNKVTIVKGFSTARAMYDALYHNRFENNILVFDDCDSVMEDKVAVNIFKGALDSYNERVISWLSKTKDKSIPLQFNFQGRVIFVSNLSKEKLDKAMISRALTIDLNMTFEEKTDRMTSILPFIMSEANKYDKLAALEAIIEYAQNEEDVNLRTLEQAIIIIENSPTNWDKKIKYMLSG